MVHQEGLNGVPFFTAKASTLSAAQTMDPSLSGKKRQQI